MYSDGESDNAGVGDAIETAYLEHAITLARQEVLSEAEAVRKILESIDDARRCISVQKAALVAQLNELGARTIFLQREVQALRFEHGKAQSLVPCSYKRRKICLLYTSPSPRDLSTSRMPSSA